MRLNNEMSGVRVAAIIPARMASSRLPGKPLLQVRGLPMIEHVRRRVALCRRFSEIVVATCDRAVAEVVESYGGRWVMTTPTHLAATDRVAEAVRQLDCTHVLNIQGDEILVLPSDLERMVLSMETEPGVPAWNGVARIEEIAELSDQAVVKCVVSLTGRILYCSRDFSHLSGTASDRFEPIRRILGILGYRRDFLERYGQLARTPLERAGSIDQSRILEHNVILQGVELSKGYPGINELRELVLVERYLETDAMQQFVLGEILSR